MENQKLLCMASAISVSEQTMEKSDVFMMVKFRLVDDLPNLNHQGVTSAFIDDMITRRDQLVGLPVYCDVERLLQHDYEHLGHMFDTDSGNFYSTQIGSMTEFEKLNEGGVSAIITTAKIPKRQYELCECIRELFDMDALKFSFEIIYNPRYTVEREGVLYVDASPDNTLSGCAVVSVPANPNSYALQMVAEKNSESAETIEGVEKEMTLEEMQTALAAKEEEVAQLNQAIAEKDAAIAEKDAKIEELNTSIAESKENPFAKEGEEEKPEDKEEAVAEKEEEAAVAAKEEESESACAAKEEEEAACAEADPEKDEMKAEIDKLKAELEIANAAKAELESMKAEKAARELEENRAMAKSFAEKQGLDVADETVAQAIAEVNYRAIAEIVMSQEKHEESTKIAVASIVGDGFEMGGKWDDLLAPAAR